MGHEGKYTIETAEVYDTHSRGKRVSNSYHLSNLYFDTVEDCRRVLEIAKAEAWVIYQVDDSLSGKEVEISPLLAAVREAESQERERHHREQRELVRLINSQPKTYRRVYGKTEVIITRGEASYDPKLSSEVKIWTSAKIKCLDKEPRDFSVSRYFSSDYRILRKGFLQDFGDYTPDASLIADGLKELDGLIKAIQQGKAGAGS